MNASPSFYFWCRHVTVRSSFLEFVLLSGVNAVLWLVILFASEHLPLPLWIFSLIHLLFRLCYLIFTHLWISSLPSSIHLQFHFTVVGTDMWCNLNPITFFQDLFCGASIVCNFSEFALCGPWTQQRIVQELNGPDFHQEGRKMSKNTGGHSYLKQKCRGGCVMTDSCPLQDYSECGHLWIASTY